MTKKQRREEARKAKIKAAHNIPPSPTAEIIGPGNETIKPAVEATRPTDDKTASQKLTNAIRAGEIWMLCLTALLLLAQVGQVYLIKKQWEASTEVFRSDQRAWIGIVGISLDKPFGEGDETVVTVVIKNTGKFPAAFRVGMNVTHGFDYPMKENAGIIGNEKSLGNGAIFSGNEVPFSLRQPNAIYKNGFMPPFIYVHGYIWYTDAFGKHTTSFCFYVDTKRPDEGLQMCSTNNWFN
jgi:hypothetical protein